MKIYRIKIRTVNEKGDANETDKFYRTSYQEFFKKLVHYRKVYGQENVSGSYSKVKWR